jgi:uncharacterized protein (TIGR03905 family)
MKFTYKTKGVCSRAIEIEVEDEKVIDVKFIGGCAGNAIGISNLVKGKTIKEVIEKLKNIDCAGRGTSCPAQLAIALSELN